MRKYLNQKGNIAVGAVGAVCLVSIMLILFSLFDVDGVTGNEKKTLLEQPPTILSLKQGIPSEYKGMKITLNKVENAMIDKDLFFDDYQVVVELDVNGKIIKIVPPNGSSMLYRYDEFQYNFYLPDGEMYSIKNISEDYLNVEIVKTPEK